MLSFGFVGSVILDNAIFCSPAVLSALSSFYLFVLLKIDHFCSEDDGAKIRYFLQKIQDNSLFRLVLRVKFSYCATYVSIF